MSPSRAGSSHSSSWSIFSSARLGSWPFCFSSDLFFSARKSENCHFLLHREKKIGAKRDIYQIFELKKKFELKEKRSRAEPSRAENTSARAMARASSARTHHYPLPISSCRRSYWNFIQKNLHLPTIWIRFELVLHTQQHI